MLLQNTGVCVCVYQATWYHNPEDSKFNIYWHNSLIFKNNIMKAGGRWPLSNNELANEYTHLFLKFVNTIDFETL
jgi:hypothetical protein